MATPTFETLSQSIIDNILTVNPAIDIKIGEAVRDLFIDVQAAQLQQLYGIADYSSRAQSVLTATGNQLDRLAYNYFITRFPPKRAVGTVTLIMKNGLTAPTLLNIGDQFYTTIDQTGRVYTFICAQAVLLAQGTVQATIPVIALDPGAKSNVGSFAINQSNYDFVDAVYNTEPTSGGADMESDAAFAARIPTYVTGTFTNTFNGVTKILFNVSNISEKNHIITPGDPLSRGPYTVDVYLQRLPTYFGTSVTETAPANQTTYKFLQQPLYELNPINQVTAIDPATNTEITYSPSSYRVVTSQTDVFNMTTGSTKATTVFQWVGTPPTLPYTINYNVDQTVRDAQSVYDNTSEIVADVLFRQAKAIPMFISANVLGRVGSTPLGITQAFAANIETLFGQTGINEATTPNNIIYSVLKDPNVGDITLTNFDSTYEVELVGSGSAGNWNFTVSGPSTNALLNHPIAPLGVSWENNPPPSSFQPFTPAGRLFIGDPNIIKNGQSPNFSAATGFGVANINQIGNISASWAPNLDIDPYYDKRTQTLMLDFSVAPAVDAQGNLPSIRFTIVQPYVKPSNSLSYIALAPSLVQPILPFPGSTSILTPTYGTVAPNGLDSDRAKVYKNGIPLVASLDGVTGDYKIAGPDSNGVFTITFLTAPAATDVLQYGLLNPDLSISISS